MNYWQRTLARRISRRRALTITGGSALTAFLVACGSGDDDDASTGSTGSRASGSSSSSGGAGSSGSTGGGENASVITKPVDTSKQAVRGGTLKEVISAEPASFDPARPEPNINRIGQYVWSTLLIQASGYLKTASQTEMDGDFAQSWEISPDRLTITMKMRPQIRWHNKAPVNGRVADIDDVLFSWEYYRSLSPFAQLSDNTANPEAPIVSFNASDDSTIVVTLKEPLSYALNYFSNYGSQSGNMIMIPKEADGGYDVKRDMIGHGPFEMTKVEPSVGYTLTAHKGYYDPDSALVDGIDVPIVPEYAARLSQFKAGNIHRLAGSFAPQGPDVMVTKKDQSNVNIYASDYVSNANIMLFGLLPEGKSPFLDQRVRQAVSMAVDRDAWLDAIFNVSGYEEDGIPVESRWNSHLLSDWDGYWLDPQGSEFGDNARYFQFNLDDAKALLDAAGYKDGFTVTSSYPADRYDLSRYAEPMDGMLRQLGIDVKVNIIDYATQYNDYRDTHGQFEGWAYSTVTGTTPQRLHPVSAIAAEYLPKGGVAFKGFSTSGKNDMSGDPELTDMINKARLEADVDAQQALVKDMQRRLAGDMWGLNMPGGASGYDLVWPAVQDHHVWSSYGWAKWYTHKVWLDQSKPPFA
jgi:peptide/nickel transport system substrate-binding protein